MQYPQAIYLPVSRADNSGDVDKYERRRRRLRQLIDERCDGKIAQMARRIERDQSYVSRMLFAEGKPGGKRIADDLIEAIERAFGLPHGWLDTDPDSVYDSHAAMEPKPVYQIWPFQTVTRARLDGLRERLGAARAEEALHEIDAYLSILLEKWERTDK